jgi:hypothetical protein
MRDEYDAIICAGDLTTRGPVSFAQELVELFGEKFYFVHGNMDSPAVVDYLRPLPGYLHGRKMPLDDWNLVGLGGSNPTPFHTPSELSEAQIEHILSTANMDERTILVSHPPPQGFFDQVGEVHVGSTAIRDVVETKRPLMVICAHVHEQEGQRVTGDTLIIKLGPALSLRAAEITIGDEINVRFLSF